ncbi:MAG: glycosyltransferase family protein [Verrucomicrobiota bacterium]|nr:glycosyltransferase family protein [Verrucomicrobiota bacterium]
MSAYLTIMGGKALTYLFIIQGEGRGHMTQAIALRSMLVAAGHKVPEVILGRNERRDIPAFFTNKIGCPVVGVASPNFVVDAQRKGIRIWPTIIQTTLRGTQYLKSLITMRETFRRVKPDVVINFYDTLAGVACFLFRPSESYVCLGHQYLLGHPDFLFPKGMRIDRYLFQLNTWWTALNATELLGLSFQQMRDVPALKIRVVPPLLRSEVTSSTPTEGEYFLAYMVNDGYAEEIMAQHEAHPDLKIEAFWDRRGVQNPHVVRPGLEFHQIDDKKFLDMMRGCRGYLTTAGFESVCEALYFGKPVYMVPTAGHIEQRCNALDATRAGAGIWGTSFDLARFKEYLPKHDKNSKRFQDWVQSAPRRFLQALALG